MPINDARKAIFQQLMESLEHISDREYIQRVWIEGKGPEVDDFDEAVNNYNWEVEDLLKDWRAYSLTESQFQVFKDFHEKFKAFAYENDYPELFIDTPEWKEIMEMAKEVLVAFGKNVS